VIDALKSTPTSQRAVVLLSNFTPGAGLYSSQEEKVIRILQSSQYSHGVTIVPVTCTPFICTRQSTPAEFRAAVASVKVEAARAAFIQAGGVVPPHPPPPAPGQGGSADGSAGGVASPPAE
jgi:hypothetical protein